MGVLERWKKLPLDQLSLFIEVSKASAALDGLNAQIFGVGQRDIE